MKKAFLIGLIIGIAWAAKASAAPMTDVTLNPVIAQSLAMSGEFWVGTAPTLERPCNRSQVLRGPLTTADGDGGREQLPATLWAETYLGSCVINISWRMWASVISRSREQVFYVCVTITHEDGHTLGLDDSSSSEYPIMDFNWTAASKFDPPCSQWVYGWQHISRRAQLWLIQNGFANRNEKAAVL